MLRNGIAHCDLSLENAMVAADGTVKHIDFGEMTWVVCYGGSSCCIFV